MKIEDAIKVLSGPYHFIDGPYWKEIDEAVRAILPAAEKQIPKEPNDKCEYVKFKSGYCPNCSTSVCGIDKYCPTCGQRLKWE